MTLSQEVVVVLCYVVCLPRKNVHAPPIATVSNTGFNIHISANPIAIGRFSWNVYLNLSHYRNKVTNIVKSTALSSQTDHTLFYGFNSGKTPFRNELEIGDDISTLRSYYYAGRNENGENTYYTDNSKSSVTTDINKAYIKDYGHNTPDVYGGFNNEFKIHDFDLYISLGFQIGGKVFDTNYYNQMDASYTWALNKDYYKVQNEGNWSYHNDMSTYIISASYLSINKIALGYTIPSKITKAWKINSLRVFADADNLALISARKGMDPRTLSYYSCGNNTSFYPAIRTISFGIQLGL